jgi:hypothetical protein
MNRTHIADRVPNKFFPSLDFNFFVDGSHSVFSAARISTIPDFMAGCFDINWIAWFRSVASNTPNPPQLLFRLGIRAIGNRHLAVFPSQGDGVPGALERFPTNKVTVLPQLVIVLEALVQKGVFLAFGHRLPLLLVKVSKADVFHDFLLS